jgi:hypothetical protein
MNACSVLVSTSTRRQGVTSRVPQHVSMNREWQLSGLAKPFYKLLSAVDRKRRSVRKGIRNRRVDARGAVPEAASVHRLASHVGQESPAAPSSLSISASVKYLRCL